MQNIFGLALYLQIMLMYKLHSLLEFGLCYVYILFYFFAFVKHSYLPFLFNLLD